MDHRSNDYISQALRIANALMCIADDGDKHADEAGFGILSGVMRDCAYKIQRHAKQERRKAKVARAHANAIVLIFAVAMLSIFFVSPTKASTIILSTDMSETLGGLSFASRDLAEYDPLTGSSTLYFNGVLFGDWPNIDAVHILDNGNIILSTKIAATLGGLTFGDGDLIEYNPITQTSTLYFDESLFVGGNENIDAVHILDSGNIILSSYDGATLGGLTFGGGDLIEYNPITDIATLFFDVILFDSSENIDAAHILGNGNIILSTDGSATLGDLSFTDGDLVEYNPTTGLATLFFNEGLFTNNADIDAVYVTTLPEPATVALLGLGFLVLIKNRKRIHSQTLKYAGSPSYRELADTHVNHVETVYNHMIKQEGYYRYPE